MNRSDPSSLSFGRRLNAVEVRAYDAENKLQALEKAKPSADEREARRVEAAARKAERNRAQQLIGSVNSSLDDLQSVDTAKLTRSEQAGIQQAIDAAKYAQMAPTPIRFTDQAAVRIQNWRQQSLMQSQSTGGEAASFPTPPTQFQRWAQRQDSPEGRRVAARSMQASQEKALMQRQQSFIPTEIDRSHQQQVGGFRRDINQ